MAELFRMAGDPLGVAFDVMVPCPECSTTAEWCGYEGPGGPDNPNPKCSAGLVPNPAITQECGTCGGSGEVTKSTGNCWPGFSYWKCPDCEGRGWTFRSSVRVAERVRVVSTDDDWSYEDPYPRLDASRHTVTLVELGDDGPMPRDITHLWGQPCPECGGSGVELWVHPSMGAPPRKTTCPTCNGNGTVVVPPEPGSVWEIGWREAELVPVIAVEDDWPTYEGARFVTVGDGLVMLYTADSDVEDGWDFEDLSDYGDGSHFPTPPEPGQRAGVLGELVLADKAVRCDG